MAAIADLEDYVSGMRKSMDDKLWFLDFIGTDVTSVYDYGCADGTLLRRVQDERPDVCLYGYDNNCEMLKIAGNRLQKRRSFKPQNGDGQTWPSHSGIFRISRDPFLWDE